MLKRPAKEHDKNKKFAQTTQRDLWTRPYSFGYATIFNFMTLNKYYYRLSKSFILFY